MDEYEALRRRYVRGEIDADEYGRRLEALPGRTVREGLAASARSDDFVVAPRAAQPPTIGPRRRVSPFVPLVGGCLMVFGVIAALGATVSGFVGALAVNEQTYTSVPQRQSFVVQGTPNVVVRNAQGNVVVRAGRVDRVEVQVTTESRGISRGREERDAPEMAAVIEQDGRTITVEPNEPFGPAFWFSDGGSANIEITVPPTADLDMDMESGTLDTRGVAGRLAARLEAGRVEVREAKLASGSSVEMGMGSIEMEGELTGATPDLDVEVDAGRVDLELPQNTNAQLTATTDAGDIEVRGWEIEERRDPDDGPSSGSEATASGSLSGATPSGKVDVRVGLGNITLVARP